jgi:hypothetical protein
MLPLRQPALIVLVLAPALVALRAQSPAPTITSGHASVSIQGHVLSGSFTYDKVGDLTVWGAGGGFIDLQSDRQDAFQYSPAGNTGKYKTTVARPITVQVGAGPTLKVVTSAAGECTVTLARADESGVDGSFACGRVAVLGPEKKILGAIDSMTGSFSAAR